MDCTYEREENTDRVRCDMHWEAAKKPHFILVGEWVNYRIDDQGNIDTIACDDCARHFHWPCVEPGPSNWGPVTTPSVS